MKIKRERSVSSGSIIVCLMTFVVLALSWCNTEAGDIDLIKGTKIKVSFSDPYSSKNFTKGDEINFKLIEPFKFGGILLMNDKTTGVAKIVEAIKAGGGGKPGFLKVEFVSIKPQGGNYQLIPKFDGLISLNPLPDGNDKPIIKQGKGKKLLSYLFIAGLFIKGSEAEISTEEIFTVTIAEKVEFESK